MTGRDSYITCHIPWPNTTQRIQGTHRVPGPPHRGQSVDEVLSLPRVGDVKELHSAVLWKKYPWELWGQEKKHISTVSVKVTLLTLDEVTKWLSWFGDQSRPWILDKWAEMNCIGWDVLRLSHTRMSQSWPDANKFWFSLFHLTCDAPANWGKKTRSASLYKEQYQT